MREIAIGREEGKVRVDGNRGEWDVIWCGKEEVEEERRERKGKKKRERTGTMYRAPTGKTNSTLEIKVESRRAGGRSSVGRRAKEERGTG
jgi:hypothetical protein